MRMLTTRRRARHGFTLLELMVVVAIIMVLSGVVTAVVINKIEEAKHSRAVADREGFESALDTFYLHNSRYPTTEEGLQALRVKPQGEDLPKWNGPYLKKAVPQDPWGNDYIYKCPGDHNPDSYDLYTYGKDGQEGGTGNDADITNWESEGK